MSKKRSPIFCPQCTTAPLVVRRSALQVASHQLYLKKGKIVVNYGQCLTTEQRIRKFWLKCSKCFFVLEVPDEKWLLHEIGMVAFGSDIPPVHIEKKPKTVKKHKELVVVGASLPRIARPSKINALLDADPTCRDGLYDQAI